ncbi:MAG: hypothetical protein FRX48_02694 [Lasallia pustulata]|uniref:Uncharacterized protein n=1 Tax=Lasallia pustulata TaxID=136370 RepID=A0A5M8PY54_9LECA|nr:MAG: hypothetical protein FRX48_02694 [Lasallia pustulata]
MRTDRTESPDSPRAPEPVDPKHECNFTELTVTKAFPKTVPSFEEPSERDDEANNVSIFIEEAIKLENPDGCDCRIKTVRSTVKTAVREALDEVLETLPGRYTDAPDQSSAITPDLIFRLRHDIVEAACLALLSFEESPKHVGSDDVRPNKEANKKLDERADDGSDDEEDIGRAIYHIIRGAMRDIIQVIHNEQVDHLDKSQQSSRQASKRASKRASSTSLKPILT